MSKVLISESTLQNMANTVRAKTGTSETLKPSEMVVEVASITPLNGQTKTVTPTTSSQTITPDSGYNALTQVNVNAVTSAIDNNIQAENIKKDVQILEVTGTYEGSGGGGSYNALLDLSASDSGTGDPLKKRITEINMPNGFDASSFTTLASFFEACRNLVNFPRIINSGNVTTFNAMFRYCNSMTSLDSFDTSSGGYFTEMFMECTSLTTAPSINLQNGINLMGMFHGCSNLTTVPQYNTSNATTMNAMFNSCSKLVTIPQFDTSKVTDFSYMFSYCGNLENVPVLSFASITNSNTLSSMFTSCSKLTNESLNNILATCLTATNLSSGKTIKKLGLSRTQCTTCTTLSNWSACEAAGWTTGY